jgi:hypothetical protein
MYSMRPGHGTAKCLRPVHSSNSSGLLGSGASLRHSCNTVHRISAYCPAIRKRALGVRLGAWRPCTERCNKTRETGEQRRDWIFSTGAGPLGRLKRGRCSRVSMLQFRGICAVAHSLSPLLFWPALRP